MTVEDRLSEWLERTTPEPPRGVSVDDLRPPRRSRAWLSVLAAACVVLIVLVSLAIANRTTGDHSAPVATTPPTTAHTSGSPSSSRTPPRPALPTLPAREWNARAIASVGDAFAPLAAANGVLYTERNLGIVAMSTSGNVVASHPINGGTGTSAGPVLGGGAVWFATSTSHTMTVVGLAELTLEVRAQDTVSDASAIDRTTLTRAPDGRLLMAGGNTLVWVNPRNGALVGRLHISGGTITGAAQAVVGGPIYLTSRSADTSVAVLRTVDPRTGAVLSTASTPPDNAAVVAASPGGIWLTYGTGMMDYLAFAPLGDLTHPQSMGYGAGGIPTSVWIDGNIAWVGGEQLACVDASTGRVLATAPVRYHQFAAAIIGVTRMSGHTYGIYSGDPSGRFDLVELHPPAKCTR